MSTSLSSNAALTAGLNTRAISQDLLGPSQHVYHQEFTPQANQPRLKMDKLGAGDVTPQETNPGVSSNVVYQYASDGLQIQFDRPANTNGNIGVFAVVKLPGLSMPLPTRFMLTGSFQAPSQVLNQGGVLGTYAPALLMNVSNTLMGVTSQFRTSGQRMNFPGTIPANRPDIDPLLSAKVLDPNNPAIFTVVLLVNRSTSSTSFEGRLYVGNQEADRHAFVFNGLTSSTTIDDIRIGLGTAAGGNYRVSVRVLEIEIWAPNPNH